MASWGFQGCWGGGGGGARARAEGLNQDTELGGVVMQHDDMVAADREEELPPGTQEGNINEVDAMVRSETAGILAFVGKGVWEKERCPQFSDW